MSSRESLTRIGNADQLMGEFAALVQEGVERWTRAGEVLVALRDEHRLSWEAIQQKCGPEISLTVLKRFEAMGRKQLHPRTLLSSSPAMVKIRLLPYKDQAAALDTKVPTIDANGNLKYVKPQELTCSEVQVTYDGRGQVRQPAEQKALWRKRQRDRGSINKGVMDGWEPDGNIAAAPAMSLDQLKDATPQQLLKANLDAAHAGMVEARRHLEKIKKGHRLDNEITVALGAIGKLRFAVNNGEL